jgi:exonuclease VII large subunit
MKASLCVGEYCENAYNVEGLDIRVYSMEELCYCLKENAFLLDLSIMNDKLVDWIGEECKVWELAKQLYPMVHKQGSLSVFVVTILQYVGMYDPEEILQVEQVLKQGAGLSNLEKRKSQIDYMVEKRKYAADLEEQLRNRMEHMIELRRHKLALLSERLEGVSPVKKLAQGYSYVTDENGHTLTDAEGVKAGDRVKIRLLKGALEAEVTEVLHER